MAQFRPLAETKFINDANLVAYYKLDGNSNDSKGANNGTDTSISYNTSYAVQSNFGQGAELNASTDKIAFSDFNLGTGNFTFSFWIQEKTSQSANTYFISGNDGTNYWGFYIGFGATDKIRINHYNGSTDNYFDSSKTLALDTWYHIVYTKNSDTVTCYINGSPAGSQTGYSTRNFGGSTRNGIGNINSSAAPSYIDDTAVFTRALSAGEVAELYQSMTYGEYLGAGSTNTKLLLHLNGSSADSSGNGNNGTDTNITYVDGKFGKCASFNGSSSKIALPVTLSGSAFTYSIWVYCTNTDPATDSRVIDIRNSGYSNYITTSIDSNLFHAAVYDGTNYLAPTVAISANVWTHFAVTVYNGNFSIYKNGASVYSNAYTFNGITAGGAGYAMIGQEFNDGASRYYNGLIDEVIIESRAWSAAEIKRYYSMTKGYYATL